MTKPLQWSYSVLSAYETCPHRYYVTKVAKTVTEPMTEAMSRGNKVHKALELRLTQATPLPGDMRQWEPLAQTVVDRAKGGVLEAEQKMALTIDYRPTTFFAKDVWVRGITDFTVTKGAKAFIGDWKTGKPTPESAQLRLTAAMTMCAKPWVQTVINSFVWLKDGTLTTERFTREDLPGIWQDFAPRVRRLEISMEENRWPKKPSGLCGSWCPVHSCEHNGKYRGAA